MLARVNHVPEFKQALRLALKLGKRTESEILNRWLGFILTLAFKKTVKADPEAIRAQMMRDNFAIKIVLARARRSGERYRRKGSKGKGRIRGGDSLEQKVKRMIRARMRSAQYVAVGFLKAAQDAGGSNRTKVNPKSEAYKSYAELATPHRLKAFLGNNSIGADELAEGALLDAIREIAIKEIAYATGKLQKAFNTVSSRPR